MKKAEVEWRRGKVEGIRLIASELGLNLDLNLPSGLNLNRSLPIGVRRDE